MLVACPQQRLGNLFFAGHTIVSLDWTEAPQINSGPYSGIKRAITLLPNSFTDRQDFPKSLRHSHALPCGKTIKLA